MTALSDAVGLMHPAYFVGRNELLDWLNNTLHLKLTKIEETASGAVACQIFDYLFPGVVPMSRVNWGAKTDWEYIGNYKVLQAACDKVGVDRKIEVDRLIKAKYQDNLEFLQWLKKFFDDNTNEHTNPDYDAQHRRLLGKGVAKYASSSSSSVVTKSQISPPKQHQISPTKTTTVPTKSKSQNNPPPPPTQELKENNNNEFSSLRLEIESSKKAYSKLAHESEERISHLESQLKTCNSEREYYFEKLRQIEVILQDKSVIGDGKIVIETISNILYEDLHEQDDSQLHQQ